MSKAVAWLLTILGGILGVSLLPKPAQAASGKPLEAIPTVVPGKYPFEAEVVAAAQKYGVPADLVAAVISWEQRSSTKWDARATNPADPSYGLGQVTPYIGVRFGIIASEADYAELYDPAKNCRAVAAFLDYLLNEKRYALDVAIQMFNEGEPNYWDGYRVPDYLAGVMKFYREITGK